MVGKSRGGCATRPAELAAGYPADGNCELSSMLTFVRVARRTVESAFDRSEEHTSELQSRLHLVCRLLLEKKKKKNNKPRCNDKFSISVHNDRSMTVFVVQFICT